MDSGERGMNPVAMTIINPRKEYWLSWGSNERPSVVKSAMLPAELWGLTQSHRLLFSHASELRENRLKESLVTNM